jgi:hypothetical protein
MALAYRCQCALCGGASEYANTGNLTQVVTCPECVRYEISDRVLFDLRDPRVRASWPGDLLSRASKRHAGTGPTMRLLSIQIAGIEAEHQREFEEKQAKGE